MLYIVKGPFLIQKKGASREQKYKWRTQKYSEKKNIEVLKYIVQILNDFKQTHKTNSLVQKRNVNQL